MDDTIKEQIMSYITGNLDEKSKEKVRQKIADNPEIKKLYIDLKNIRMAHEELSNKFVSSPIPTKTLKLFDEKNTNQSILEYIKKGYFAFIGWIGFLITGGLLIFPVTQMQMASKNNTLESQIAQLEDRIPNLDGQSYSFRGLENDLITDQNSNIGGSFIRIEDLTYEILIEKISENETETCLILKFLAENKDFFNKQVCLEK